MGLTKQSAGILAVCLAEEVVGIPTTATVCEGSAKVLLRVKVPASQVVLAVSCV